MTCVAQYCKPPPRDGVTHYSYGEGFLAHLPKEVRGGVTHYSYGEGEPVELSKLNE